MEPHAVPRQITTFEFKLIGFLTLKQFIYLLFTTGISLITYYGTPIPILNVFITGLVVAAGLGIAFVPVNERPMDVWIRNFFKKLTSASQYYYIKNNLAPDYLRNIVNQTPNTPNQNSAQKSTNVIELKKEVFVPPPLITVQPIAKAQTPTVNTQPPKSNSLFDLPNTNQPPATEPQLPKTPTAPSILAIPKADTKPTNNPFLWGTIKNNQNVFLPNILIYIKDGEGKTVRLLKTNNRGIFATYHTLEMRDFFFEIKDPESKYFFDTMKLKVLEINEKPFNFQSKEII